MTIEEALKKLESEGFKVDWNCWQSGTRIFYHIDGLPRSEAQILEYAINGVRWSIQPDDL
jgi:hypothetical protein